MPELKYQFAVEFKCERCQRTTISKVDVPVNYPKVLALRATCANCQVKLVREFDDFKDFINAKGIHPQ